MLTIHNSSPNSYALCNYINYGVSKSSVWCNIMLDLVVRFVLVVVKFLMYDNLKGKKFGDFHMSLLYLLGIRDFEVNSIHNFKGLYFYLVNLEIKFEDLLPN